MSSFKKFFVSAVVLTCISLHAHAQADTSAKIYFIRSTGYNGLAVNFHCFIDSQLVCNIKNKKYSIHQVPAGKHSFIVRVHDKKRTSDKEAITIDVQPNQTYYIKLLPQNGYVLSDNIKLSQLTETAAKTVLTNFNEQKDCL